MQVTFNFHSCFTVELKEHIFVFDYFKPNGDERVSDVDGSLSFDKDKKLYFFASHHHPDHFTKDVFEFRKSHPDAKFILSDDIWSKESGVTFVSPRKKYDIDDISVETTGSTDMGVAFLVKAEDKCIFHGGDLNWWYWEERGEKYLEQEKSDFLNEINLIKDNDIDVAFMALDPRLNGGYDKGMTEFLKSVPSVKSVFPMHLWKQYRLIGKYKKSSSAVPFADKVISIEREGQVFEL